MASFLKIFAEILAVTFLVEAASGRSVNEKFPSEEKCKNYVLSMIEMRREQMIQNFYHGSNTLVSMWYEKHQNAEEHDSEFLQDLLTKLNKLQGAASGLLSDCVQSEVARMKETIPQSCHEENNFWTMGEKEQKELHLGFNVCFYEAYKKLQTGYDRIRDEMGLSYI